MLLCEDIRKGLTSYEVITKLMNTILLPLNISKILEAMEMSDRIMSERALEYWITTFAPLLHSNTRKKEELYPHEFLILLAQSKCKSNTLHTALNAIFNEKLTSKGKINGLPQPFKVMVVENYIDTHLKETVDKSTGSSFRV